MAIDPYLPSTTWQWKRVRVPLPPEGHVNSATKSHLPPLSWGNPRKPVPIRIRYRSGQEAWFQVEARGRDWRFPGYMALYDVMRHVWGEL